MSDKPQAARNGSNRAQFIATVRNLLRQHDQGRSAFSTVAAVKHALVVLDKKAKADELPAKEA